MNLKDKWDQLDSDTRNWLLDHPASLVLPPAISARFGADALIDADTDEYGQIVLSREDHAFIRDKAEAAGTIQAPATTEYRFFDTASLPQIKPQTPIN